MTGALLRGKSAPVTDAILVDPLPRRNKQGVLVPISGAKRWVPLPDRFGDDDQAMGVVGVRPARHQR